jgi:two-component system chemotaxis response regulator CheY
MEYLPNRRLDKKDYPVLAVGEAVQLWRLFHIQFKDLPETADIEKLANQIFKIFESLPGSFYFHPRYGITIFCKMADVIIIDDIIYKIKNLIKGDYTCRIGEQFLTANGLLSLQFLFAPSSDEQQRLSQEFIMQEKTKRANDIIMLVEDDLFVRNIVTNALKSKFKIIDVPDGAKATSEYLSHSPDVLFLDIHLPNKKGPAILKEILEVDPQAYVVMLSADAAKDRVIECMQIGAKGFIAKPFRGDKLFDYIRKCPTIRVYC